MITLPCCICLPFIPTALLAIGFYPGEAEVLRSHTFKGASGAMNTKQQFVTTSDIPNVICTVKAYKAE